MTPDARVNRPVGSPPAVHKRQVDSLDTLAEAVDFRKVERRTSSFSNRFSHADPATAESWL